MARDKVYFISDLHLGAGYFKDPLARERHVVSFLDSVKDSASEIYLLGDILDYWFEYKYVVPRGFVRFFGKIAELSDIGVKITWLVGNHDIWISDYIPSELGITVIDGAVTRELCGQRFYMAHGDATGVSSLSFRILRSVFRNKFCQKAFSAIHPRWTVPFAHRWSSSSRKTGYNGDLYALQDMAVGRLKIFAESYLADKDVNIRYFLFGHLHCLCREKISENSELIVLGDWISHFSYAVYDGKALEIHRFRLPEG